MKRVGIILVIFLFSSSCQEKQKVISEKQISEFNLADHLTDFKQRMTELDTIRVSFDHSICEYQGYEQLEITKIGDSIRVKSLYKDYDQKKPEWKPLYEDIVSQKDSVWDFENFIIRNDSLKDSVPKKYSRMIISHRIESISFSTTGLIQALAFLEDYNGTMKKLNDPEGFIYGYSEKEMEEIIKNISQ